MLNIVLFGPPGAGKGTHSKKLVETYDLIHFSTGDILRAEITAKTQLGILAKTAIDKGELVSDDIVIGMMRNKIKQNINAKGLVFDGFPRTIPQAESLDKLLIENDISISTMLMLDVKKQELINRLQKRAEHSGRTDDADINIINNRIEVYEKQTLPIADFYKKQNKFLLINGIGSIETIFGRIQDAVNPFLN